MDVERKHILLSSQVQETVVEVVTFELKDVQFSRLRRVLQKGDIAGSNNGLCQAESEERARIERGLAQGKAEE